MLTDVLLDLKVTSILIDKVALSLNKVLRSIRVFEYRRNGAKIGSSFQAYGTFFHGDPCGLEIGNGVRLRHGSQINLVDRDARLVLGDGCFFNYRTTIDCHHKISIGDMCAIGPNCYICDFDHEIAVNPGAERGQYGGKSEVIIEENCWIGANCTITRGTKIGRCCVIGAGSVVRGEIPPFSVAVGAPAEVVRKISAT